MSGAGMQLTEEEALLDEMFDMFDRDHNGTISIDELGKAMRGIGCNPTDSDIQKFCQEFDTDKSGKIDKTEFRAYVKQYKSQHKDEKEELKNAFRVLDKDNNGFIEASELKVLLQNLGQHLPNEMIEDMIKCADQNGDGKINYIEFADFICSTLK